jgi:anti-sigma-K factor RskA
MNHQELKDHLPLYVLGGLDSETIHVVELHLAEPCESCAAELQEWQELVGLIPLGLAPAGPTDSVKARLMERVRQDLGAKVIPLRPRRKWTTWVTVPLAAAAVALVLIGAQRYQNLVTLLAQARQQLTEQDAQVQQLTAQLREQQTAATLLAQARQQLTEQETQVQQLTAQLHEQQTVAAEKTQLVAKLETTLAEQQTALAEQRRLMSLREQELTQLRNIQTGGQEAIAVYERQIATLKGELARQHESVARNERELQELRTSLEQQRAAVAASTQKTAQLREALARQRGVIEVLTSPGLRVGYLQRARRGLSSQGHVLWNTNRKPWLFYAFGMPQPPAGKEYQVWFMTEREGPVSAGVFAPDANGTGVVMAEPPSRLFGQITAAAVTLEPAGGLPKPSGEMYLRGSL